MSRAALTIAIALLMVRCGPTAAPPSAAPSVESGKASATSQSSQPVASATGDVVAQFIALVTAPDLSYVIESSGSGTFGEEKATIGGRGRVDGDDVDMFFGINGITKNVGVARGAMVTAGGTTLVRANGGPWTASPAAVPASTLWLGGWASRPITYNGVVQRAGRPLHELKVEIELTSPAPLLPPGSVVTERTATIYVRDDGTPVSAHETIAGTQPVDNGSIPMRIEINHSISALGIPQEITLPSG